MHFSLEFNPAYSTGSTIDLKITEVFNYRPQNQLLWLELVKLQQVKDGLTKSDNHLLVGIRISFRSSAVDATFIQDQIDKTAQRSSGNFETLLG